MRRGDLIRFGGAEEERVKAHIQQEQAERTRVLQSYGNVKHGDTISRDIAVPGDLPLYALHYVIQRLFGWQNCHLHHFRLSDEAFLKMTGDNAGKWSSLVGVLFQSPEIADEDRYWADDYEDGSFKTWLKKKYTGPYMSLNHGEGILQSKMDVARMKMYAPYIELMYGEGYGGGEFMYMAAAKKTGKISKKTDEERKAGIVRKVVVPFDEAPVRAISLLFEGAPYQILERLTIEEVLVFRDRRVNDKLAEFEEICDTYETFMDDDLIDDIQQILESGRDEPWEQPYTPACTDTLYYEYDYGDGWMVRITGSTGCADLVEKGLLTKDDIDKALISILTKYKPVCLFADGLPYLKM